MINKIFISINKEKPNAFVTLTELSGLAKEREIEIVEDLSEAQCIISLGGDGTFLYAAHSAIENNIPLLGINLGRFGFLPYFDANKLDVALDALNSLKPNERLMLSATLGDEYYECVNEFVIERKKPERAARITAMVFDSELNDSQKHYESFVCDGVILATPTGSTAYSSSAGGPALSSDVDAYSVTFSALHNPRIPPVVVKRTEVLSFTVEEECVFLCDGRFLKNILPGDQVSVTASVNTLKVYERPENILTRLSESFGGKRA
jgi:NAD+ kinase